MPQPDNACELQHRPRALPIHGHRSITAIDTFYKPPLQQTGIIGRDT